MCTRSQKASAVADLRVAQPAGPTLQCETSRALPFTVRKRVLYRSNLNTVCLFSFQLQLSCATYGRRRRSFPCGCPVCSLIFRRNRSLPLCAAHRTILLKTSVRKQNSRFEFGTPLTSLLLSTNSKGQAVEEPLTSGICQTSERHLRWK